MEEFDISVIAYELYKQDWVDTHTTGKERLDCLRDYYEYRKECIEENDEIDSFDEWIWDGGYNGSIYVCYEEFCDEEYHDKEYISSLLKDDELIALYYQDIDNDDEV